MYEGKICVFYRVILNLVTAKIHESRRCKFPRMNRSNVEKKFGDNGVGVRQHVKTQFNRRFYSHYYWIM